MSEHDPLERLARTIDEPVDPNPAFAAGLKSRLLQSLAEAESAGPVALSGSPKLVSLPERGSRSTQRGRRTSIWLQIAAVLILAVGVTAASISLRHNESTPTVIPAIQGQATGSSNPASEVAPAWRALPEGEPNLVTVSASYLEDLLAIDGERLFRLVWTSSFEGVIAYDASTGAVLWQQEFQHQGSGLVTAGDGLIFVRSTPAAGATISAFDQQTGTEIWSTTTTIKAHNLVYADERLYIWDGMAELIALDTGSGEEVAARRFTHADRSGPEVFWEGSGEQLIVAGDTLVVGTMGGLIVAVPVANFDTAPFLWRQEVGNATTSLAIADGVIAALTYHYTGTLGSIETFTSVTALDLATGEILWEAQDDSAMAGPPHAISGGFVFVLLSRPAGTPENTPDNTSDAVAIHARDARTGEVLWIVDGYFVVSATPDGNGVIALEFDAEQGSVTVVSATDGQLSPNFMAPEQPSSFNSSIDNERVYVIDEDYALVAYELSAFFDD